MKIDSIKNYNNIYEILNICNEIYLLCNDIKKDYPGFAIWLYKLQLEESINSDKRDILFVRCDNKIIAFVLLKKYKEEKKICSIYVDPNYRRQKIGTKLLNASFDYLVTTKPLITIRDYKIDYFKSIIKKYDWQLTDELNNYYGKDTKEYCYNKKREK